MNRHLVLFLLTAVTTTAAGAIQDGEPHPTTLASVFCVPPSFDDGLDAAFDLPGPAAVSLPGMLQLQ